jgi:hypothetical protein
VSSCPVVGWKIARKSSPDEPPVSQLNCQSPPTYRRSDDPGPRSRSAAAGRAARHAAGDPDLGLGADCRPPRRCGSE